MLYQLANDNRFQLFINNGTVSKDCAGVTFKDYQIIVPLSRGNINTRAHEIGHTLMLGHGTGVMRIYVTLDQILSVQTNNARDVISNGINQSIDGSSKNIKVTNIGEYTGANFYRSWLNRHLFDNGIKIKK
jgi:hypothetical protein